MFHLSTRSSCVYTTLSCKLMSMSDTSRAAQDKLSDMLISLHDNVVYTQLDPVDKWNIGLHSFYALVTLCLHCNQAPFKPRSFASLGPPAPSYLLPFVLMFVLVDLRMQGIWSKLASSAHKKTKDCCGVIALNHFCRLNATDYTPWC